MTTLLEIKEHIKNFCSNFDIYLLAVVRVIFGFIVYGTINANLGYNTKLTSIVVVVGLSLAGAILPVNFILIAAALLILAHMYALSSAVAIVCACFLLILFFIFFRFSPKNGYMAVLTPIANIMGIPYVMPMCAGLMEDSPTSSLSVISGTFFYYFLKGVKANSASLSQMNEEDTIVTKINETIAQVTDNREMIVMMVVMFIATILVWFIRKRSFDHAWAYAIATGCLFELVAMIVGANIQNFALDIPRLILGVVISAVISLVLEFFFFNLDYDRTERVQFEDDDYYYYVKAVPKRSVAVGQIDIKTYASTDDITREDVVRDFQDEDE